MKERANRMQRIVGVSRVKLDAADVMVDILVDGVSKAESVVCGGLRWSSFLL
jgi:hypothetical protein